MPTVSPPGCVRKIRTNQNNLGDVVPELLAQVMSFELGWVFLILGGVRTVNHKGYSPYWATSRVTVV